MKKLFLFFIIILGMCLQIQAADMEKCFMKSDSLLKVNQLSAAIDLLNQCITENPSSSKAYMKLGQVMGRKSGQDFQAGKMNDAMTEVNQSFEALDKAIQLDGNNVEARITYGIMGLEVPPFFGKLNSSVQHLEAAKKMLDMNGSPELLTSKVMVYQYLGEGYKRQEKYRDAEKTWNALLKITPEGAPAEAAKEGLASIEQFLKEEPQEQIVPEYQTGDIPALIEQGKQLLKDGQYPEARKQFESVMALDDKNVKAQMLLIQTISMDADRGYDHRIYEDQDTRTHLAFDLVREMEKGLALNPHNTYLKLQYAMGCLYMPFFVGKLDKGLEILETMAKDESLPDSIKQQVMYSLGFGYQKKGASYWAQLVKSDEKSPAAQPVYEYYGVRDYGEEKTPDQDCVEIEFHLGFQDELAPQTALWIEDASGHFVKTVYVSGFAGNVKEKQITLREWGRATKFETDGTTGASIDWGTHHYIWDLKDHTGKRVKNGTYKICLEVSWWPTFRYAHADVNIEVGKKESEIVTKKEPFVPMIEVEYKKR